MKPVFAALVLVVILHGDGYAQRPVRILIDASSDGGTWWFPQGRTNEFLASKPHQGKALADYLRRKGADVEERPALRGIGQSIAEDRNLRRARMTTLEMLTGRDLVVRAGNSATLPEEIAAYKEFVAGGGKLLLMSEYIRPPGRDLLAESFGIRFMGISRGENVIDRFVPHAITKNVRSVSYRVGSGVVAKGDNVTILGFLSRDTYLDIDSNEAKGPEEPVAAGVLGILTYGKGLVVFLGDTNTLQPVPQPLTNNIFNFLLGR